MTEGDLHRRAIGAYLGMAVGDALGATVEFMNPREIRAAYGVHRRICGGGWLGLEPGQVTDDTEMALALGDAILKAGWVDPFEIAAAFDNWMRGKPVDIGHTVRRGLMHWRQSGEIAVELNEFDAGNGACMRVLPVALCTYGREPQTIQDAVLDQAHITHHNLLSDAGTLAVVEMVQAALAGAGAVDLLRGPARKLIDTEPRFNFRRKREENPSGYIVDTLNTVFQGVFDTDNFEDCLVETVNRGGDADTTGAIAGMIAGALYGEDAIPQPWLDALDPNVAGHCRRQAEALLHMALSGATA